VRSRNVYFPYSETVGKDEMRVSFIGSCPIPQRRDQAATCIMVELGNGNRFFFDFGPGCVKNIIAMGVRRTQIVAIGAAGGVNAGVLEETFASCISAPHPRRLKPTESVVEVVDSGTRNS
jgi:hypothetical protein